VGDWVFLKLQPFVQQSVARRSNRKLSSKFFGPYLITQKVGLVAYKLQLPASSHIHPVVHVSQLKKALPPDTLVSPDEELTFIHSTELSAPEQVLQTRLQRVGNKLVPFACVRWKNVPQTWTTWEKLQGIQHHLPQISDGEGMGVVDRDCHNKLEDAFVLKRGGM
jgi:hypothetical protein